jgi:K+-sensing histidine kinase KdpD
MNLRQFPRAHRGATVLAALVAPLLAAALLSLFRTGLTAATDVLLLVAVVVVFSATGIRTAGLAAALSAVVWFDLFLTQPYGSLAINDPDDLEAAVLLLVIGGVVTETALWGLRQEAALSREVGYLDGVLATAEAIALRDHSPEEVTAAVAERIREVLGLDACTFAPGGPLEPTRATLQHDGSLTQHGRELNVERDGFPVDAEVVLPVRSAGAVLGRFLLTSASHVTRPTAQQRRVAVLLADQVAAALHDTRPTSGSGPQ